MKWPNLKLAMNITWPNSHLQEAQQLAALLRSAVQTYTAAIAAVSHGLPPPSLSPGGSCLAAVCYRGFGHRLGGGGRRGQEGEGRGGPPPPPADDAGGSSPRGAAGDAGLGVAGDACSAVSCEEAVLAASPPWGVTLQLPTEWLQVGRGVLSLPGRGVCMLGRVGGCAEERARGGGCWRQERRGGNG